MELTRREVLAGLVTAPLFSLTGCDVPGRISGSFVGPSVSIGHRLREGWRPQPAATAWSDVDVVIVGGGVAGLSTARVLKQAGLNNFVVLELEPQIGGTSVGGKLGHFSCPWGAHYLPVPLAEHSELISFLQEAGLVTGLTENGEPQVAEQALCRDPEERLYYQNHWIEGLYPFEGASQDDLRQWADFHAEMRHWANWKDMAGRRAFSIPLRTCSDAPILKKLRGESFADWLDSKGFHSSRLRWVLDYSCRDDYGLTLQQTSAWAGLFYFAARLKSDSENAQPLLTWPDGNAQLVQHLSREIQQQLHSGCAVTSIKAGQNAEDPLEVISVQTQSEVVQGWRAQKVVFAAPQYLAPHLIHGFRNDNVRQQAVQQFTYGSWLVANVALKDRPLPNGFPLAWDNVFWESSSLGYVVATHQLGHDFGPTVFTWYEPWCDDDPQMARHHMLALTWEQAVERVLSDLEQAHPEIRTLVERIDIMRWGHAMIRPTPQFLESNARQIAAQPWRGIHFAQTDLSGIALFEEAFDQGCRAAREVLQAFTAPSTATAS